MRRLLVLLVFLTTSVSSEARFNIKKPVYSGLYFQWGYNRDWFSKSDLHFRNGSNYDFTVHKARAHDQPDFSAFRTNPIDITIPQNSFRIGVYLNKQHTHSIELNFDHAKYVYTDSQHVAVTGHFKGKSMNSADTMFHPNFLHMEHTNGANFWMINYVGHYELLRNKKKNYRRASVHWKAGAGLVIPKSDVVLNYKRLDNKFHIAGYVLGLEAGARFYPLKNLFLEANIKGGFANYLNVLTVDDGGRIHHSFWYGEVIGLLGYDINIGTGVRKKKLGMSKQP
jgi:hypothetical protein